MSHVQWRFTPSRPTIWVRRGTSFALLSVRLTGSTQLAAILVCECHTLPYLSKVAELLDIFNDLHTKVQHTNYDQGAICYHQLSRTSCRMAIWGWLGAINLSKRPPYTESIFSPCHLPRQMIPFASGSHSLLWSVSTGKIQKESANNKNSSRWNVVMKGILVTQWIFYNPARLVKKNMNYHWPFPNDYQWAGIRTVEFICALIWF
jgi:hypothetical protein